MSGDDSDQEKPHEATERKLQEARKRGEMPRTADITAAAGAVGMLFLALLPGGWVPPRIGDIGVGLLTHPAEFANGFLGGGTSMTGTLLAQIGVALAPVAIVPGVLVVAALFALKGWVFAPEKLAPKLSRISPLSNAKNKFGPSGLMEFIKSAAKMSIYGAILWYYLLARMPQLLAGLSKSAGPLSALMMQLIAEFMAIVVVVMVIVGGLDYLWQVYDHKRKQRMSHQELREDHKAAEGDPHTKQQRRQRGHEIATNKMLSDVPKASVIVVNPTHFAVALSWAANSTGAPVCVAKGTDEIAARIREIAKDSGIPIHSDPPTARALFAATRIGDEISPDHYQAVAAAIRFAEEMRTRARKRH